LWNTYGDCLFALRQIDESQAAFRRAITVNPNDARSYFNLSFVYLQKNALDEALTAIAKALALDKAGEYRDGLLQKQAEILKLIAGRHQQAQQLYLNRTNRVPSDAARTQMSVANGNGEHNGRPRERINGAVETSGSKTQ
jgi:tetratricopeptide (TPR) repeat protein